MDQHSDRKGRTAVESGLFKKSKQTYTELSNLNRESFMHLLGNIWNKWAKKENILKAGKRVCISSTGLNVNWMQDKFNRAESLVHSL